MVKLLHLDYAALIIYILMITAWLLRTRKSSRRRSFFSVLLFVATFATIYDVCAVSLDNHGQGGIVLKYIMHSGYLILRNLVTPMYLAYIISVADTWHIVLKKKTLYKLACIPFILVAVLTATSSFTHYVFYIDANGVYTRGPLFILLYISALFYTSFCIIYAIKYAKVLGWDYFIPLISIAPSQVMAVIVQFIFPHILCEMIATVLSILLIMLTIERPESRLDLSSGLLKSNEFMEMVISASKVKKPYCVVLIHISNYSALNSYLSFSNMNSIYATIGRRLEAIKTHLHISPDIFNLENGLFAAVLYKEEIPYGPRYAQHILDTLKRDYTVNNLSITLLPNVCVIKVPDDTNHIDEIRLLIKELRNTKFTNEIILASTLMKSKDYTVMANMDSILKHAIENDIFQVYYQPIYSNELGRINSAEALIRLNTPEYGFIRPDLFIPLAEESGAIHQIGMIVLEKVCKFISSDEFARLGLEYIEVNLSVVQCMDKTLPEKISNVCQKYGVNPSRINLEITETASTYAQKTMLANINTLHEMGFSFSLDDFGTGYSNMVRIASLPLHIVKLDRSFTWTENNDDLKLILENTISMVKNMGMKIVVEGVETKEMLYTFTRLGCEYIQGYYFSKPLPEYDFIQYVLDRRKSM